MLSGFSIAETLHTAILLLMSGYSSGVGAALERFPICFARPVPFAFASVTSGCFETSPEPPGPSSDPRPAWWPFRRLSEAGSSTTSMAASTAPSRFFTGSRGIRTFEGASSFARLSSLSLPFLGLLSCLSMMSSSSSFLSTAGLDLKSARSNCRRKELPWSDVTKSTSSWSGSTSESCKSSSRTSSTLG